ncbi:tetratricopeptide repeat protein [Gracilimonas amylolytica]|uniref:tetratricopeptide repeat protein n=1 Tax=Gracilimonas amylolytica TaxID=1749045 RepID=UPI000CD9D8AB|nr:tetratricopeptide repeat protein [Gracilimonas amylolytica]
MKDSREKDIRRKIDAYIKGSLGEEEIQGLWNEFAKDPELLDLLELEVNLKEIIERESGTAGSEDVAPIRKLPKWTWHAAAAAAIILVALVQFFRVDSPATLDQLVVQNIEPSQIETSNAVRAAKDMRITSADSLLNLGFQAFLSGNDDRALDLYEEVIANYNEEPYGSKAYLNKGIIHYNEFEFQTAIHSFEQALERVEDSRMITEKAYWYLGNALVNIGELEEARVAVTKTYQLDGVFRSPAFRLLKKLNQELGYSDYEEVDQVD